MSRSAKLPETGPHDPPVPSDPAIRRPSAIVPTCDCFVEKGMEFDRELGLWICSKCGQYEDHSGSTPHQQRIEEFMDAISHQVCDQPYMPPLEVRKFRARIMLEEMLELINDGLGLGIQTFVNEDCDHGPVVNKGRYFFFELAKGPSLLEIADGAADVSVTTIGTLSTCGIRDKELLELVDQNNLDKVKPPCPNCKTVMRKLYNTGSSEPVKHTGWSCLGCETHYPLEVGGYTREDGKWVKGTNHRKVDLTKVVTKH